MLQRRPVRGDDRMKKRWVLRWSVAIIKNNRQYAHMQKWDNKPVRLVIIQMQKTRLFSSAAIEAVFSALLPPALAEERRH